MIHSVIQPQAQSTWKILLIGNPNCGKTTIFNGLTGAKQKVGNWSGVTVEKKSGHLIQDSSTEIIDLPGIYSLSLSKQGAAIDERIAAEAVLSEPANLWINIVDANSLERHLYLSLQLREMGTPMMIVLNMADVAKARGKIIHPQILSNHLHCPVMITSAKQKKSSKELAQAISDIKHLFSQQKNISWENVKALQHSHLFFPDKNFLDEQNDLVIPIFKNSLHKMIFQTAACLQKLNPCGTDAKNCLDVSLQPFLPTQKGRFFLATRLLEGDACITERLPVEWKNNLFELKKKYETELGEELDILIADARYQFIQYLISESVKTIPQKNNWTARLDTIFLNRILGLPIFLGAMYALFFFAINIGGAFQDFFDQASDAIFIQGVAHVCQQLHFPLWLTALFANGIGKGLNTTLTFVPVLAGLFLCLSWLEDSGYMARAAFVADRFMQYLGLSGKTLVPLIVGFGCNVPAVMGARTLEHERHRIMAILMAPFMACGARLAIFAVFTAAFFPSNAHNIVFALYLIGIGMAIFTGFMLKKTILRTLPAPFIMELPPYHLPQFKSLMLHTWQRLRGFIWRAGKLIIPICMIIGALNTINIDGSLNSQEAGTHSILSTIGKYLTPLFAPMGIDQNNWPATVGLLTGVLAKEVVVGTLNALYVQVGHLNAIIENQHFNLWQSLIDAAQTIPNNFLALRDAIYNPILAKAPTQTVAHGVYGEMAKHFHGQASAFAYLLFVLLYIPCISTIAVIKRELSARFAWFASLWMLWVAYAAAVLFYQSTLIYQNPLSAALWIIGFISSIFLIWKTLEKYGEKIFLLSVKTTTLHAEPSCRDKKKNACRGCS